MKYILLAICLVLLSACSTTKTRISSTTLVHPEKSDSTADFQACSYNNKFMLRPDDFSLTESEKETAEILNNANPGLGVKVVSNTTNRKKYKKKVQLCLKDLGWKRAPDLDDSNAKSRNRYEYVLECLEESKIGDKVDHKLMNTCLDNKVK